MPHRKIPICLAVLLLAAISASATDFWIAKEWKQWSSEETNLLLAESPWVHTWTGGHVEAAAQGFIGPNPPAPVAGMGFGIGDLLAYTVQIRSSLPVRQAIVRQLQFNNKYEKMTDNQRTDFDAQAAKILNRNYDDTILVHVDYSRIGPGPILSAQHTALVASRDKLDVSLLNEDSSEIKATRVDVSPSTYSFDAIFPRIVGGAPTIKDGQRRFAIRFQSPLFLVFGGVNMPAQSVKVQFNLSKMLVNGKPNC
jgi:hypothetical protein